MEGRSATIGPSIHVKGELMGNEDLVIEGRIEGIVRLRDHHLTVGKSATILATVEAKSIRVEGNVQGDVQASERVELAAGSSVVGDVTAPRVSIADGARFKGSVDMDKGGPRPAAASASPAATPAAVPAGAGKASGSTP
jgi:cytoskeletal protein CcmA (bactofilin family)